MTDEQAQYVTVNTVEELEALPIGSRIEFQDVLGIHLAYKRTSVLWDQGGHVHSSAHIQDDLPATVLTPATRPSDDASVKEFSTEAFTDVDDVREVLALAFSRFRDGMVPYPYDYELADVALSAISASNRAVASDQMQPSGDVREAAGVEVTE